MKKERNYTVEFLRFMFAINFLMIHAMMIFPKAFLVGAASGTEIFTNAFDVIIPFMAFAGYFLMSSFKKEQKKNPDGQASSKAGRYLWKRIKSLFPIFFLASFLGFIANRIWQGTPIGQWPAYFLNAIGEFSGLHIFGIGLGNASTGSWGGGAPTDILLNTPLWFISGIFVIGYFIYYLLAKNEKHFVAFVAPLAILLFMGSQWLSSPNQAPLWTDVITSGIGATPGIGERGTVVAFSLALGSINMFAGLSVGVIIWALVDKLRGKEFSKTSKILLTVLQVVLFALVIVRSWFNVSGDFVSKYINIGWGSMYLLTMIFSFLVLLQVDYVSKNKVLNSKIWAVPGRMSMYVYMLHFPIIIFTAMMFGITRGTVWVTLPNGAQAPIGPNAFNPDTVSRLEPKLWLIFGVATAITLVVSFLAMLLDTKVIQPRLNKPSEEVVEEEPKELVETITV